MGFDFLKEASALTRKAGDIANSAKTAYADVQGVVGRVQAAKDTALGVLSDPLGALSSNVGFNSLDDLLGSLGVGGSGNSGGDFRIRLRAMKPDQVYGANDMENNILAMLYQTDGLLFPYTPTIDWNQSVDYATTSLTHTNQDFQSYKSTPSTTFRISGDFTVQNYREGQYMLAVIHFLRVVSKMHFGKLSKHPGMPPPVLLFSGYGDYMFNDLPVIVKDHAFSLGKDMDYVDIETASGVARLPALLQISMTLVVQNTPKKLREEFDLDSFRTGKLMKSKGWI